MTTTPYASAYRQARAALAAVPTFTDPNLSDRGIGQRRAAMLASARATLQAAVPTVTAPTVTRGAVLAARAPKTADQVAVAQHEQAKVVELRAAGLTFAQIVAEASAQRVAALADGLETIAASSPFEATELAGLLFDRLVGLNEADAVTALAEETQSESATAWQTFLTEAAVGDPSFLARQAVHAADPSGYAQLGDDVAVDWHGIARVEAMAAPGQNVPAS